MAYSETIKLVTGDTEPMLTITLRDANTAAPGQTLDENDSNTWAPIDLTGATVRLRMRAIGSTTVKSILTMAISNAINGVVTTNFPTGTLDTSGTFEGEIEITYPTGGIQTLQDLIKFQIRKDFD
ncbi:MAG: hypothetical protein CBD88_05065 [Flavobacteriales bacterium TMED228]|nr:MAG: hypothetical protein CBD88_05065 [Flavobacteriales bacterium TMED228]